MWVIPVVGPHLLKTHLSVSQTFLTSPFIRHLVFMVLGFKFGQYKVLSGFQQKTIKQATSLSVFILKKKQSIMEPLPTWQIR